MYLLSFGAEDPIGMGFETGFKAGPTRTILPVEGYMEMDPAQFPDSLGGLDGAESYFTGPEIFSAYEPFNLTTGIPWDEWFDGFISTVGPKHIDARRGERR